ncbi:MAG: hypothetical protein J6866_05065, partial [Victivallales bacterium]|nr:hypothetical protein [Victivallales bacterium]
MIFSKNILASLSKTILLVCLWLLASPPLRANLQYECPGCSGTDVCDCDLDQSPDETPVDSPDEPFGRTAAEPAANGAADFGSLKFSRPFGRAANEPISLGGKFSLYAITATPLVFTTQFLQYRNRLLDSILQTEVSPAHCARILGADWESRLQSLTVFGRVVTD